MKILKNILFWLATVSLVAAIAMVAVPKIFGVEFRAVLTGSMEPELPVGSLLVIVPTESEDIKMGDAITFVTAGNKVVTHRVVDIDREENKFTTWGIANDRSAVDPASDYENIIGVVRLHIPVIGQAFTWLASTTGKIIAITAIVAVYIISLLLGVLFGSKKQEEIVSVLPDSPEEEDKIMKIKETKINAQTNAEAKKSARTEEQIRSKRKKDKIRPETTDEFWNGDGDL